MTTLVGLFDEAAQGTPTIDRLAALNSGIARQVGDPYRASGRPDAAWQAIASNETSRTGSRLKPGQIDAGSDAYSDRS